MNDRDAKSIVKHLLVADLSKRYGNLKNGTLKFFKLEETNYKI